MDEREQMFHAIEGQYVSVVKKILDNGFDPNQSITEYGFGPAYVALCNKSPEILDMLIIHGAHINHCSDVATTLLQTAVQTYPSDNNISLELVDVLTRDNRTSNRDILGQALQYACGMGFVRIVDRLLQTQADPNYFPDDDEFQMTPIIGMIFENEALEGHVEILELLMRYGANLAHISGDKSVLEYAIEYNRNDLLPILSKQLL
jgi:ankyrin repeat protein